MAGRCPKCLARLPLAKLEPGQSVVCACGAMLRVRGGDSDCSQPELEVIGDLDQVAAAARETTDLAASHNETTSGGNIFTLVPEEDGQDLPEEPIGTTPTVFRDLEAMDRAFAALAVNKGLVTRAQVDRCVEAQRELAAQGVRKTIQNLLVEKDFLTATQAERVRRELESEGRLHQIGGFRIVDRLGKGGMGTVYRARQVSLDRDVALKILPRHLAADEKYLARFLREARSAAQLHHPNIVQAIDAGEDRGFYYFAMELVEGQSVRDILEAEGPLSAAEAVRIAARIADALAHAWERARMIHRDIKPGNILLEWDGTPKLADLGLAKSVATDTRLTATGELLGSPGYISPECAQGRHDLDQRGDIYSLGCTLFHMLTGKAPYDGDTPLGVILKHVSAPPPDPRELASHVSEEVAAYVMKMMAKRPEDRPQSAADVAQALDELYRRLREQESVPSEQAESGEAGTAQ